jgi:hypothetical protein
MVARGLSIFSSACFLSLATQSSTLNNVILVLLLFTEGNYYE